MRLPIQPRTMVALAAIVLAFPAAAPAQGTSSVNCAVARQAAAASGGAAKGASTKRAAEAAAMVAQIDRRASAAEYAGARARLNSLANATESRGSADSRAAADALRRGATMPGTSGADALSFMLGKIGC